MLFSVAYAYQTKVNFSLNTDPGTVQKAYGVFNVSRRLPSSRAAATRS
jgi:iron complex outermembrane receptor protein